MPFAHDWAIFYLSKDLGLSSNQILSTLGVMIVWESAYGHHLFNRLEQVLRNKFGHFLFCDKRENESTLCNYKNTSGVYSDWKICIRKYSVDPSRCCLSIELVENVSFYIDPEEDYWIVEIAGVQFVDQNEQAKRNLVKAINKILV